MSLRCDDLMNGLHIWQDTDHFCFGIDAVLLAHYPVLRRGDLVLDLGTGFAPVPLILSAEAKKRNILSQIHITGLELQERPVLLAKRSVEENGLKDSISILQGDIKEAGTLFAPASFSLITCNPPYLPAGSGLLSEQREKAIARTELCCSLEDVIHAAGRLLKMSGRFALIHRPERLPELFVKMKESGLEPKRMRLVCPRVGEEPTMVLAEAVRGGRPSLKVAPPLYVYGKGNEYTQEVLSIYGIDPT